MIIELYGLPGSGKTTFVRQMEASSNWIRIRMSGKLDIFGHYIWGYLLHPVVFTKGLVHCMIRNRSLYYLWNFYFVQYAKYQKACHISNNDTYAILDEGPLQTIISYPEAVLTKSDLLSYIRLLPKVDKVIIFNIDQNQRKKQLRERVRNQSWRKKHDQDEDWDGFMVQNDALFKEHIRDNPLYYFYNGEVSYEEVKNSMQNSVCG
ncbi:MAG: hypothetical protein ACI92I_000374 [Acidimicrobiales bacterium]|jgi:hypothetical protein